MTIALAVTPTQQILAGEMSKGVFVSGDGQRWLHTATGMVMGLAVDPQDGRRIIATSYGIAISLDDGTTWKAALRSKVMFGPVAWAPQKHGLAYAVGYDRSFWRSADSGKTWKKVS